MRLETLWLDLFAIPPHDSVADCQVPFLTSRVTSANFHTCIVFAHAHYLARRRASINLQTSACMCSYITHNQYIRRRARERWLCVRRPATMAYESVILIFIILTYSIEYNQYLWDRGCHTTGDYNTCWYHMHMSTANMKQHIFTGRKAEFPNAVQLTL